MNKKTIGIILWIFLLVLIPGCASSSWRRDVSDPAVFLSVVAGSRHDAFPVAESTRQYASSLLKDRSWLAIRGPVLEGIAAEAAGLERVTEGWYLVRGVKASNSGSYTIFQDGGVVVVRYSGIGIGYKTPLNIPVVVQLPSPPGEVFVMYNLRN